MAGAIERRHHIGNGENDHQNQSQNSGDAQKVVSAIGWRVQALNLFHVASRLIQALLEGFPQLTKGVA